MSSAPWDQGLQNERTGLSWQRTLLSGLTFSLLLARLLAGVNVGLAIAVGVAALACSAVLGLASVRRYVRNHDALTRDRVVEDGWYSLVITVLVSLTGVGAIAYVMLA
jgi:uncharacterized membrane protein YidH (DUF202 family)